MKTISKFLFFAFLLFFNSAFADLASDAEKLFSWGEQKYPSYFSIGKTEVVTKILNYKGYDWHYRYYPETKVFLAINELNKVYVLGGVFGKNLLYIGRLENLLDVPLLAKPSLTTTPTTTQDDTVEVEVNGEIGASVFVNGVDSGKTIDSTGKVKVILDTSGDDEDKSFSITLKDDKGNKSETLSFSITKQNNTLTEGLVAHYEFEGNANDSSGNGNNGTEHGRVSYTDRVIGKAASFDGNSAINISNLGLNNIFNNKNYSISLWYKSNDDHSEMFEFDDDKIRISRNGTNDIIINYHKHYDYHYQINIDDNIFNHTLVIVDMENKIGKFYFNGTLISIENNIAIETMNDKGFIGKEFHKIMDQDDYFTGLIDDLRIYNRALSENEIKQLYKMGQQ